MSEADSFPWHNPITCGLRQGLVQLAALLSRGSTELPALLASGERYLLPGGDHLPVLHLLDDGADLTGRCHDCKRKAEDNYSGGRKEGDFLTHFQMSHVLKEDVGNSTRYWKMLF